MLDVALAIQLLLPGSLQRLPVDPLVVKGRTPFDDLQKKFDRARGVSIRDLGGWYAGRCFYLDSPTKPVASVLAVDEVVDKDLGPAFGRADYRRVIPLVDQDGSADIFDVLTPAKAKQIRASLLKYKDVNAYPAQSGGALVVEGLRTADLESRRYILRRSKNALILRLTCSERSFCLNYKNELPMNRVVTEEGESNVACYYFLKVSRAKKPESPGRNGDSGSHVTAR